MEGNYLVMDFGFTNEKNTQLNVSPAPNDNYVPLTNSASVSIELLENNPQNDDDLSTRCKVNR
jgi:hypothetical protein